MKNVQCQLVSPQSDLRVRRVRTQLVIVLCLFAAATGWLPASAATTGTLTGIVTSDDGLTVKTRAAVEVASPTAHYATTTDTHGFFALTGVTPDTYTITVSVPGYQAAVPRGMTVVPDQTSSANVTLKRALREIGCTAARSVAGAFQPQQTTDTYALGSNQISTLLGREGGTSEIQVVAQLPGAMLDNSGYPIIRGGRSNEAIITCGRREHDTTSLEHHAR